MGYFKINRGKPIFSLPDGNVARVLNARQEGSYTSSTDPLHIDSLTNSGVIYSEYAFAVLIDFKRAIDLGGSSIKFSVKERKEASVYKTGITDIVYTKKHADTRVTLLRSLGLGNKQSPVRGEWQQYKSDISLSDLMKNKRYELDDPAGLLTSSTFLSSTAEDAAKLIEDEINGRREVIRQADLESTFSDNDIPTDQFGRINWANLTPDDLASFDDETLSSLASAALASIGAAGQTGIERGRTVYMVPDQVSVHSADMYWAPKIPNEPPTELSRLIEELENDVSMVRVDNKPKIAQWELYNSAGILLDSFSYEFNSVELLDAYFATSLSTPDTQISYSFPTGDMDSETEISINTRNGNDIALEYIIGVEIEGIADIGNDQILTLQTATGIRKKENSNILLLRPSHIYSKLARIIPQFRPNPVGLLPPGEVEDVSRFFKSIIKIGIHALAMSGDQSYQQIVNILMSILVPKPDTAITYHVYYASPMILETTGDIVSNAFSSISFPMNFANATNEVEESRDEQVIGNIDSGLGGFSGGLGGDGSNIVNAPHTIIPAVNKPFSMHISQVDQSDPGLVRLTLRSLAPPSTMSQNFTNARIIRDVVGDSGFESYCDGNRVILRPSNSTLQWDINRFCSGELSIEDRLMPNIRYRYDIELADTCFEYAVYQSQLFTMTDSSVDYKIKPLIEINALSVNQGPDQAAVSFRIDGSFSNDSLQTLVDALIASGQGELYSNEINEQRGQLNSLICYEVVRNNLSNGDSASFGIYRGPRTSFVDTPVACRAKGIPPLNPASDYVYDVNIFVAKGEIAFSNVGRTTVDPITGLSIFHTVIQRDAQGNELPNAQQYSLLGQNSYVPGPDGFWPTGRRRHINISGTAPVARMDTALKSVTVQYTRGDSCYNIVAIPDATSHYNVDIYCMYRYAGNEYATFYDKWPLTGDQPRTMRVIKTRLWDLVPVTTSAFNFKLVVTNSYGQVVDTAVTDRITIPLLPSPAGLLEEPVIPDAFIGQIVNHVDNPYSLPNNRRRQF